MKKSFSRIWGVGLVLVILASLLLSAVPVSAGELAWGSYGLPGTANNILVTTAGLDILDIAVGGDGQTIYVATGATDNRVYKSTNGGKTWSTVSLTNLPTPANLIAVAPDDANYVIVAGGGAANLVIAASTNGGSSFSTISPSAGNWDVATATIPVAIYDIGISPLSGSTRMVGAAGASTAVAEASNDPALFYFNLGAAVPSWTDAINNGNWDAGAGLGGGLLVAVDAIRAVAFSPYFASDQTAVVASETRGAGAVQGLLKFHILSFNQKKWDSTAGFTGYPFTIKSGAAATTAFTVNNAEISLDPSYLGGDDSLRVAFVGTSITSPAATEVGGIFRLKDTSVKALLEGTGIKSVSWNGINLVAGPTASNTVKYSADALASSPSVSSASILKRPGLDSAVTATVVRWAGANVVGAGSDALAGGSAFAISTDNGKTFNDVSLIDAVLTNITQLVVAQDGSKVFMLTNDGTRYSLWVKTDAWWRIWQNATAPTTAYLVRGALDNKDVLYIADQGATNMWYTDNGGMTKWFPRASRYAIADLAVESSDVAYVATVASVSKTTNKGFTWGDSKSASLSTGNIYSITVIAKDKVIVGGVSGYVAYSADGNANWNEINKILNAGANTVVTASSLDSGGYIYASAVGGLRVERWTIGTSTSWKNLGAVIPAGYNVNGIQLAEAVLFALATDGATDSQVFRTIGPTGDAPTWSNTNLGAGVFATVTPGGLRTSAGSTTLWAVDTGGTDEIWSYLDTLTTAKPVLAGPADAAIIKVNLISGNVYSVSFSWNRPHAATSVATLYDIRVAEDPDFNVAVVSTTAPGAATTSAIVSTTVTGVFNPDTKYYWKIRVNAANPVQSNYSDVRSFTIAAATVTPPVVVTIPPPAPAPIINLPAPIINLPAPQQIVIPAPQQIIIPPAPAPPAPIAPAYIWAVVIIGAVLVIAVIILIVRTRRPV